MSDPKERLESIRKSIEAEEVSMGELAELQGLAPHIDPSDVVLLQWAGVPEHGTCPECGEANEDEEAGIGPLDEPNHLHCDFCTKVEHAADLTTDWNGETGNHLSCESKQLCFFCALWDGTSRPKGHDGAHGAVA